MCRCQFSFEFVIDETQPNKQAFIDVFASNEAELTAIIEETVEYISTPGSDGRFLINGHKWEGDARPSFASACGMLLVCLQGYIAAAKGPIDAISSSIDFVDSLSGSLTKSLSAVSLLSRLLVSLTEAQINRAQKLL